MTAAVHKNAHPRFLSMLHQAPVKLGPPVARVLVESPLVTGLLGHRIAFVALVYHARSTRPSGLMHRLERPAV